VPGKKGEAGQVYPVMQGEIPAGFRRQPGDVAVSGGEVKTYLLPGF
jgi:hypothetical protein